LVEVVLERLVDRGHPSTALADEWSAIKQLDPEEVAFCSAAARLGLDPFAVPSDTADILVTSEERFGRALLTDFLDAADPEHLGTQLDRVEADLEQLSASSENTERLPVGPFQAPDPFEPWISGQHDAKELRRALGAKSQDPLDLTPFVYLWPSARMEGDIRGVGTLTRAGGYGVSGADGHTDQGRRFHAARAVWRFGFDREPTSAFLLTRARTRLQQAERAFAAELLAPVEGIRTMLPAAHGGLIDADTVQMVSDHFGVSDLVVKHQVENHLDAYVEEPA
jgi:hypothetical protein